MKGEKVEGAITFVEEERKNDIGDEEDQADGEKREE